MWCAQQTIQASVHIGSELKLGYSALTRRALFSSDPNCRSSTLTPTKRTETSVVRTDLHYRFGDLPRRQLPHALPMFERTRLRPMRMTRPAK